MTGLVHSPNHVLIGAHRECPTVDKHMRCHCKGTIEVVSLAKPALFIRATRAIPDYVFKENYDEQMRFKPHVTLIGVRDAA